MSFEIVATGYGGPEVLQPITTDVPAPGADEVRISVRAAGVNPRDQKAYGDRAYTRSRGQDDPAFPMRLGVEASGVVTAVGADALGPAGPFAVGDEVVAYRITGAYADEIIVPASAVVPKPTTLDWAQAAAMMLSGTTAAHALAAVRARPGQTVLVHAAGGGVGLAVVQLAVLAGLRVIGTSGPKSFDTLRSYGAEPVAYGDGLLDRVRQIGSNDGVDCAIDLVGTDEAVDVSLATVDDRTRIASVVVPVARCEALGILALGGAGNVETAAKIRNAARLALTALAQAGRYDVSVTRTFALEDAAQAHELLRAGGAGGRIALVDEHG